MHGGPAHCLGMSGDLEESNGLSLAVRCGASTKQGALRMCPSVINVQVAGPSRVRHPIHLRFGLCSWPMTLLCPGKEGTAWRTKPMSAALCKGGSCHRRTSHLVTVAGLSTLPSCVEPRRAHSTRSVFLFFVSYLMEMCIFSGFIIVSVSQSLIQ